MIIALLAALLAAGPGISLEGAVRSSDSDAPIPSAQIEAEMAGPLGAHWRVSSDSAGHYEFSGLSPGTYHLRVSRVGFDPRELDVFVGDAPRMVVDVVLIPRAVVLAGVRVTSSGDLSDRAVLDPDADVGTQTVHGRALHANPGLAEADALASLSLLPGVSARGEEPTSLHVHGASGSENLVLIDGIPLFNPYHAAGTLTAINPDVVSGLTLHAGAPSAGLGDATGSIIAIASATPGDERVMTRGALSPRDLRETISGPMLGARGSFIISGRRSLQTQFGDAGEAGNSASFGDVFAKGAIGVAGGNLELLAFHSSDLLSFDAHGPGDQISTPGNNSPVTAAARNAFSWHTGTNAMRWQSDDRDEIRWEARAWHTSFGADIDWAPLAGAMHLNSALLDDGLSAQATMRMGGAQITTGVSADRYDVRYTLLPSAGAIPDSLGAPLALSGAPGFVSAFAEARWHPARHWSAAVGLRDELLHGDPAPEPRISVRYTPSSRATFAVGYARQHQYVQSLRNEESLLDAVTGIALPAIAGSSTPDGMVVPVARADQLTGTLDVRLTKATRLAAGAFARRASNIVLTAPVTTEPFATTAFTTGTERASGLTFSLLHDAGRLFGEIGYSLSAASRASGDERYIPSFLATHALTFAAGLRVAPQTTVRFAVTANSGTATSVLADELQWADGSSATGGLAGSPNHIVGALNGARLPAYLRFDLGARRSWQVSFLGRSAVVTGLATLSNVLNRENALGLRAAYDGRVVLPLALPQRSARFALEWTY